ncbi:MAG: L-seryl-tRNA(Sec) selenium transferase [Planctomycetaceae bacterium]|nr:L-seryl-tRNA(Sec) selenium transferase [Planctomycetaceae bacterium]
MGHSQQQQLRQISSVDAVLQDSRLQQCLGCCSRLVAVEMIRRAIAETRQSILDGTNDCQDIERCVIDLAVSRITEFSKTHYQKVVNAAGIILHTGLGRAVLPAAAMRQIQQELAGYSLLQVGIEDGKRSRRDERVEQLLQILTGAPAAMVVNNNAAATALILNTIACGKEVIVSRGQLVEIGGSFRLPDVMAFSGAKLVEVGTTNKTHLRDYENAITENTAAILRVHPSNYKVVGFTSEVPLGDLVELAHSKNLVLFDDVGAGSLIDFSKYGFEKEPTLLESVQAGADVITSSGDKLIGGPQAGIILGRAAIIQKARKNQFARIVRVDKLTLAALEATLKLFLNEQTALNEVPTLQMLLRPLESISAQALDLAAKLKKACPAAEVELLDGFSETGSGSLPAQNLPTRLIAVTVDKFSSMELAKRLRQHKTPVFARIHDEKLLLDPRTLLDGDLQIVIEAFTQTLA